MFVLDRRQQGFTLIEMMIVVACTSILIVALSGIELTHRRIAAGETYRLRAIAAMEIEIERLRGTPPAPPAGGRSSTEAFTNAELALVPGARGERVLTLRPDGLLLVSLKTTWQPPHGEQRTAHLVSLLPPARRSGSR
jgi:prepilin-type N-terminal cleavage/methylation domain-containing protein